MQTRNVYVDFSSKNSFPRGDFDLVLIHCWQIFLPLNLVVAPQPDLSPTFACPTVAVWVMRAQMLDLALPCHLQNGVNPSMPPIETGIWMPVDHLSPARFNWPHQPRGTGHRLKKRLKAPFLTPCPCPSYPSFSFQPRPRSHSRSHLLRRPPHQAGSPCRRPLASPSSYP